MVVLDTSVIIDHLRQKLSGESYLMKLVQEMPRAELALSVISIQELYEGKSTKDRKKEEYILATITPLKILPYTYEIAQLAGEIARDLTRTIELADAAIAATALLYDAELATLNKKDFVGIKGLKVR